MNNCSVCNKSEDLIESNNPLVPSMCFDCAEEIIDTNNLEHADFFCRTFNFPFNPNKWIKMIEKDPDNVIRNYIKYYVKTEEIKKYTTSTRDVWQKANREWEKTITHSELLENMERVKDDFMKKGYVKWGPDYTFEELIQLENLFSTTIASFDINNPMQIDAIKKACKLSIMIDQSVQDANIKRIKDLSESYNRFIKTAKIDEMIESSQGDVLRTIADLVNYLEKEGFEFEYYDNEERDVVDATINDMKEYLRTLVLESTGLEQTLEMIKKSYNAKKHNDADQDAASELPLDEIVTESKREFNEQLDEELKSESISDDFDE